MRRIFMLCLCLCAFAPGARAAETIRMIAVDSYSPSALWVRVFIEYFIPEVDRQTRRDWKLRD